MRGEEHVQLVDRDRAVQPLEAGDEDELQLGDDRAGDPEEEVVEASVVEVVLDTGAADPPGAAVHDDELPVVEVAEPAEVPGPPSARRRRLGPRPWAHGPHDADVHAAVQQPPVELTAGPVRA